MTPTQKIRIACIKNYLQFKPEDVKYVYTDYIEHAKELLRAMGENGHYQSDEHYIPGLPNVAAIEIYDDKSDCWYFYN